MEHRHLFTGEPYHQYIKESPTSWVVNIYHKGYGYITNVTGATRQEALDNAKRYATMRGDFMEK
jgi:hypothetical protein